MGGPRIIFTRFASGESPRLRPWLAHRTLVIGNQGARRRWEPADAAVVWQLFSANNRELARSADVFDDFQDAVASAAEVVDVVERQSTVVPVSDNRRGAYGWYLSVLGVPAAVCARWYPAERERRHAVALALESFPIAQLGQGAREHVERESGDIRSLA